MHYKQPFYLQTSEGVLCNQVYCVLLLPLLLMSQIDTAIRSQQSAHMAPTVGHCNKAISLSIKMTLPYNIYWTTLTSLSNIATYSVPGDCFESGQKVHTKLVHTIGSHHAWMSDIVHISWRTIEKVLWFVPDHSIETRNIHWSLVSCYKNSVLQHIGLRDSQQYLALGLRQYIAHKRQCTRYDRKYSIAIGW